jgi:hypothetical protein
MLASQPPPPAPSQPNVPMSPRPLRPPPPRRDPTLDPNARPQLIAAYRSLFALRVGAFGFKLSAPIPSSRLPLKSFALHCSKAPTLYTDHCAPFPLIIDCTFSRDDPTLPEPLKSEGASASGYYALLHLESAAPYWCFTSPEHSNNNKQPQERKADLTDLKSARKRILTDFKSCIFMERVFVAIQPPPIKYANVF